MMVVIKTRKDPTFAIFLNLKTVIGVVIMSSLLLSVRFPVTQSFTFQRTTSFSATKRILRSRSSIVNFKTRAQFSKQPLPISSSTSTCGHRHRHHHDQHCKYHRHHYSKTQKDYPILPLSTIQKYIGENRTIASEPFTWDDLCSIILEQKDVSLLSRSLQIQSNYIHYTNKIKEEWVHINDCIVYTKFGDCRKQQQQQQHQNHYDNDDDAFLFQKVKDEKTNKYKIQPSIQETKEEHIVLYKLLPNDFPYFVTSNIQHYCLWKLNGSITDKDIENAIAELKLAAEQEVQDKSNDNNINDKNNNVDGSDKYTDILTTAGPKLGKVIDTISWINPKHLQSIPDIDHAQILSLRETIEK